MLDSSKVNESTGEKVREALIAVGVETPMHQDSLTGIDKQKEIEEHFRSIMVLLGLDITDDSLKETPRRVAKMFLNEIFWGLDYRNFPKVTTIENKMQYETMLLERHIKVVSECEHHFLPIIGEAFVAYVPNEKIIGLSKINRIVEFFCRRPQVQERLTEQIYCALSTILDTENVAVLIRADHSCVKLRGVEDSNSDTITSRLGGIFYNGALRNEFYQMIKLQ